MTYQPNDLRLRALASEQHAKEASGPAIKLEWEELARQWHLLANLAAKEKEKDDIRAINIA